MTTTYPIGARHGVELNVAAWDGVGATVALSAICMFSHEPPGRTLSGGALHVDEALGGALTRLRHDKVFTAARGDTLMLEPSGGVIAAERLLVIGLGDPGDWSPIVMAQAAALATSRALELGVVSVAFAPSLLDAGMSGEGTAEPMIGAVAHAIDQAASLVDERLRPALALRRFTFDAGAAHAEAAAMSFRAAFGTIQGN